MGLKKKLEILEHSQGVYALTAVGTDRIFTSSGDGNTVLWNLNSGKQESFVVQSSAPAYALAASDHLLILGLNNGDMHWIDLLSKKEIKFFKQHQAAIFKLLIDTKKNRLYSADADGYFGVWDLTEGKLLLYFQLPCGKIRAMGLQDNNQLAIGGQNGQVYIFETEFFNEIHQFYAHESGVSALIFHPEKNLLISGGKDAYMRIWDAENYGIIKAFPAHLYAIYGFAFSPDKKFLASCSRDKTIKIWDAQTFDFVEKLDLKSGGHKHSVNAILWQESGLISVSDDRKIILWE